MSLLGAPSNEGISKSKGIKFDVSSFAKEPLLFDLISLSEKQTLNLIDLLLIEVLSGLMKFLLST